MSAHGHHGHHGHSHGHHGHHHGSGAESALRVALLLNLAFLILEVVAGLWANSLALLSDAGHMVSDVAALALALVAERLARARPGGNYTFGLKRIPILGAFGNAVALIAIVGFIFWESYKRFLHPPSVSGTPVLIVGIAGLFVNLIAAWWLHRSESNSLNVRGAMLHLLADALGSIGAIISAIVLLTVGWQPIDALVSVLIGTLILISTWPLLRDSVKVLLQVAPAYIDLQAIRAQCEALPAIEQIADFHVWELNSGDIIFSAVFLTPLQSLHELDTIGDTLRNKLREEYHIEHATFEWRSCSSTTTTGCEQPQVDPPHAE